MRQLKYNYEFNDIVEDIIWKKDDIPENVINFINKKLDEKMIYDISKHKRFCSKCFSELTSHKYCKKCHKKYYGEDFSRIKSIVVNNIDDEESQENEFFYYVFDFDGDNVILYEIINSVYLYRTHHLLKISKIGINKVMLVRDDSLFNLIDEESYSYKEIAEEIKKQEYIISDDFAYIPDKDNSLLIDYLYENKGYVYTQNLELLKNSIYKYTFIWDTVKYLKDNGVTLYDITLLPLTNPSFEYLVKYGLLRVAYDPQDLVFKNNFKDTFNVDKKYLDYFVKNNFNYDEIKIFSYSKLDDVKLIRNFAIIRQKLEEINKDYGIEIKKIINYFINCKIHSSDKIYDYSDYLELCEKLGYDLNNKRILFPKDLVASHNKLVRDYKVIVQPKIKENITKISKILEINRYEDDVYIIYPAPTLESLIEESSNQNNCVKSYCDRYSTGKSLIFFMRKKSNINKSLVTIEVNNNKVVQARIKNNELPNNNLMNIINNWERKLVPIEFEKCEG